MNFKLSTLLLVFAFSTSAFAEFVEPGATSSLTTVKSISRMKDDDKITLEGYLVKETRSEHYTFKDATGEVEVEIDNKDFRGLKVTPKTKIRIMGEVDKDWTSTTVDADYLEIVE